MYIQLYTNLYKNFFSDNKYIKSRIIIIIIIIILIVIRIILTKKINDWKKKILFEDLLTKGN